MKDIGIEEGDGMDEGKEEEEEEEEEEEGERCVGGLTELISAHNAGSRPGMHSQLMLVP